MPAKPVPEQVAVDLQSAMSLLVRRLRQVPSGSGLRQPERSALSRIEKEGPLTSAALARSEQVTPQSMGATVAALERRSLVLRTPDPADGRRVLLSITSRGSALLRSHRDGRVEWLTSQLRSLGDEDLALLGGAAGVLRRLVRQA